MSLRHRAMQPEDIRECVDLLANHPVIGPRYGPAIEHLPAVCLRLLEEEAITAIVFHAEEGSCAPISFFGMSAIVNDDFLREVKTPPHFWTGPEITKRIMRGKSPLLAAKQIREANTRDGLNLLCWEGLARPGYETHSELHHYVMSVFIQAHQGYLWKEVIANQPETEARLLFLQKTGANLWDPLSGSYTATLKEDPSQIVNKPHIFGKTRDLELNGPGDWAGGWISVLFHHHPPIFGFNRSEQQLLSCALPGATDEHLAGMLGTSVPAVKKMWVSIYHRVEDHLPTLIPDALRSDIPANGRGREKRRGLLAYLREHPEELRPVSRKLLSKATASR